MADSDTSDRNDGSQDSTLAANSSSSTLDVVKNPSNTEQTASQKAGDGQGERGQWGNHIEFFLTSLGLAVGLGNLWRFPYVCYENGGGTFLVPYLLSLVFIGLPLFFMEAALGQFAGTSCTIIYRNLAPGLKGLGYGMLSINTIIQFYYTVIMAWGLLYMFEGWRSELPWTRCNSATGSINCYSIDDVEHCGESQTFWNFTCLDVEVFCKKFNHTYDGDDNPNGCVSSITGANVRLVDMYRRISPSEEFFKHHILGLDSIGVVNTWESYGEPRWMIIGSLALSWTIVSLGLVKGISSYGKLSYFITLFPYVILTVILIFVSQEDGFHRGIEFFLTPHWEKLRDSNVWLAAVTQIFYSLGVSIGCQLALSSYNSFHTNCHRDTVLIALLNSGTSIFAGFVVFGTLGMLAERQGLEMSDVITEGTGLAFQVYPAAVTIMNPPQLFSFMFFFMLCLLAMSSISASWEPVVASVLDDFPNLRKHKTKVYFACCFVGFLCGISCCFPSGYFMFDLLNHRISHSIIYVALLEVISVAWFYGIRNFMKDLDLMKVWIPYPLRICYMVVWTFIIPVLLIFLIYTLLAHRPPNSTEDYVYPDGIQALGWLIEMFPVSIPLAFALYEALKRVWEGDGEAAKFLRTGPMLTTSSKWGPRADRPAAIQGVLNEALDTDGVIREKNNRIEDACSISIDNENQEKRTEL